MNTNARIYYLINGITLYRLLSAPFLLLLVLSGVVAPFKWLVAFSFFTDAIDGPLSRKYKATSVFGARLDSVADDATVFVSTLAVWILFPEFVREHWIIFAGLFALFTIQTTVSLVAYKKVTSFHTYLAKGAAVAQAAFFILRFFDLGHVDFAFYTAAFMTAIQLVEEIVLVVILPKWQADVKGLYWVLRSKSQLTEPHES